MVDTGGVEGIGIGLRMELAEQLLDQRPDEIRWLELHPENYMDRGGRYPSVLKRVMERWPVATHGLTMSYGHVQPHDPAYLSTLRGFLRDVGTPWHSDHLCFGAVDGVFLHDLLPLPLNEDSLNVVTQRYQEALETLDIPLAFENVSYYAPCDADETDEIDFVCSALERNDAKMLLDVNNVYVNSKNHGFDPRAWIDRIPADRVLQIHVAGHLVRPDGLRIDTHAESICEDVYALLDYTLRRIGPKPVLLERDGNYPTLSDLRVEVRRLTEIYDDATEAWSRVARPTVTGAARC